jgi:actin-related protein
LDFYIGNEALKCQNSHNIIYPMRSGVIENWDLMEKFWHRSIFDYMRAEPDETVFLLTEPPMVPHQPLNSFRTHLRIESPSPRSTSRPSTPRD